MGFFRIVRMAIAEESSKNHAKAFNLYKEALRHTKSESAIIKIRSRQAWCIHMVGNPQETEKIYSQMIQDFSHNPWTYLSYSKYLIKIKRYKQAKKLLSNAIQSFPDNLELYLTLASLLKDTERSNEAIEILKKALARENLSRGRGILRKDIWAELGTLFFHRGDYNAAISSLKKALRMDLEENFLQFDLLSISYLYVGDPENAIYYLDKYIRYNGEIDEEILILKARCHCLLGQYPHASASLLQAYSIKDSLQLSAEDMVDLAPLKQLGFLDNLENLEIEE